MKRFFRITLIVLTALTAVVCSTLLLGLNSTTLHQMVIRRVNGAIPGTLTLGKLHLSLFSLKLELHDVTLADPAGEKLTGFSRLLIDVSPSALFRRALVIEEVAIENPWASLEVDSSGRLSLLSAFPSGKPKERNSAKADTSSEPLQITLQSLTINGGKISYATAMDSFTISSHGLTITANGESSSLSGNISVTFDSTTLHKNSTPLHLYDLALFTQFRNMDIDTFALTVHTDSSIIALNGNASSLKNDPSVNLTLAANISFADIQSLTGGNKPLTGSTKLDVHIAGKVANPDLDCVLAYAGGTLYGYAVDTLALAAQVTNRTLELKPLFVRLAMGSVAIKGTVDASAMFVNGFLEKPGSVQELIYNLSIDASQIPLQELAPPMSGIATVNALLRGRGAHPDSLSATAALSAAVAQFHIDTTRAAQDVLVSCSSSVAKGIASIHALKGSLGTTALALNGRYGLTSGEVNARLSLSAPDLNELLTFVGTDSVSGSATIAIDMSGSIKRPHATISLNADSLMFKAIRIGTVAVAADLDKSGTAHISSMTLTNRQSSLFLAASAPVLKRGVPVPIKDMFLACSLATPHLFIEDFIDSINGTIAINATVNGSIENPNGYLHCNGSDIMVAGQTFDAVKLDATFSDRRVMIAPLLVTLKGVQDIAIQGWASLDDSFNVAISVDTVALQTIAAINAVDSLNGIFSLHLQADGTYKNPTVRGNCSLVDIQFGSLAPDDILLQLALYNKQIELNGKAVGDLHALYNLDSKAFSTQLVINQLPIKPYFALTGHNLDGILSATIDLSGKTDSITAMAGTASIDSLNVTYDTLALLSTSNVHISLDNSSYAIPDFSFSLANKGSLTGSAMGHMQGPHDVAVHGNIPLMIARYFSADLPDIEGSVAIDATLSGAPALANVKANIQLNDIGMTIPGITGRLHSLHGHITASDKLVRIESLQGNIDNGLLHVNGEIQLDSLRPSGIKVGVMLKALPIGVPDMLDLVLDGNLQIAGTPDTTYAKGDISLVNGLYFQDVDLNPLSGIHKKRKRKESAPLKENTTPFLKNMRFDIGVQAREPFQVDNNMAQLTIVPDLQLMGTLVNPALNGRAKVDKGTITYQKRVFNVEKGIIDFVNPYAIEPEIDIIGSMVVRDWTITIALSGPPDNLVFTLSCDDENLEDQDLLSLLVIGKTTAELQGGVTAEGTGQSNQQMLASLIASTFGNDIKKSTGLDILEVETGGEKENSDRIAVTMGIQITKRLATKYTIESEEGEVVRRTTAEYRILQNLNIAGYQDTRGILGGEIRLTWEKR